MFLPLFHKNLFFYIIIQIMLRRAKKFKNIIKVFLYSLAFLFISCQTTRSVTVFNDYKEKTITSPELTAEDDGDAYIFFRLYNPCYSSPLNVTNLLKFGISTTNLSDIFVSHASIGFDLNDDFYGVTLGGKQQLKLETCTDVSDNPYMSNCDPTTSEQYVYALKVSRAEYDATRKMVQYYLKNVDVKYSVIQNFPYSAYSIRRKFFTRKKHQDFGSKKLTRKHYNIYKDINPKKVPNKFVCSSFIAFVLMHNVSSIQDLFISKNVNYRYVVPGDFTEFPGMIKLFYSSWDDYLVAAQKFVSENPDFAPYFGIKAANNMVEFQTITQVDNPFKSQYN